MCGGRDYGNTTSACWILDDDVMSWSNVHNLSQPRSHHVSWTVTGGTYIIGGTHDNVEFVSPSEVIDLQRNVHT